MSDDNLPSTIDDIEIEITLPPDVQVKDTIIQVKSADLQVSNDMLRACYAGFGQAKSVSSLCKLIDTTMNVVEKRRKVLCMPYGAPSQISKTEEYDPLD